MRKLLDLIAAVEMPNVFNPWKHGDALDVGDGPTSRTERLRQHFDCEPRYLLIGEAPGYQGCRFSGVPFTNEKLLMDGTIPRIECKARFTTRPKPWSEPSATIMWGTLHNLGIAAEAVLWNAFAWHPHEPGKPHSNRTPSRNELLAGLPVLRHVVSHFSEASVVAIGRKAELVLWHLDVKTVGAVRHPAMGGAAAFRQGMAAIVKSAG